MNPFIQLKKAVPVFLVALVCFGLLPKMQAVSPAPDGGYPGGNTAEGQSALLSLTTGGFNTAVGFLSLRSNTTNSFNTAIGAGTLLANTAGENTATGAGALLSNTTGSANTANGTFALFSNTTGSDNTASGAFALFGNTTGTHNTANGLQALLSNTTGGENTASGVNALAFNTTGAGNTAVGFDALFSNTTGNNNTANGFQALYSNTTGSNNVALGNGAGLNATTGNGNVYIGQAVLGVADESNHTYIRNINTTPTGGSPALVTVDLTTGLLGYSSSSRRYKEDIKPMDKTSEGLYRLHPVTYRYKKEIDRTQSPAFGLIAEEVAEVNPDLVARNAEGQPESVHYEMVSAMLLNEFLKEHGEVAELKSTVAEQRKGMEAMAAQLKEQAAQIQKVSAQLATASPSRGGLEASKFATGRIRRGGPAPQVALNNP